MKSQFKCPACGKPLSMEDKDAGVELWCGHGPCKSRVACMGTTASTELAAHAEIENMVERENVTNKVDE